MSNSSRLTINSNRIITNSKTITNSSKDTISNRPISSPIIKVHKALEYPLFLPSLQPLQAVEISL